jgi:hypothetical protein
MAGKPGQCLKEATTVKRKKGTSANHKADMPNQVAPDRTISQPRLARPEPVGMVALQLMEDGHVELHAWVKGPNRVTRRRLDALRRPRPRSRRCWLACAWSRQ